MISANDVRKLALSLPEAEEHDHWGRPSFRVRGRIFATLWAKERRAVLKLSLDEQEGLAEAQPDVFAIVPWGHQGWTKVDLGGVDRRLFRELLVGAWRRLAPKRALALWDGRSTESSRERSIPRQPVRI